MEWYIPLIVALLIIIAGIVFHLHLGLIMFASGLFLMLLHGVPAAQVGRVAWQVVTSPATQILFFSVILLELLGHLLKATGSMRKMISSLYRLCGDLRYLTVALPTLIGLLAVPGGAIMAAPMVEEVGDQAGLSRQRQAAVTLWFRHVIYFMLPLFPSLILAAQLSGVSVTVFVLHNLSLTLLGIIAAFFVLFRGIEGKQEATAIAGAPAAENRRGRVPAELLYSAAPLVTILLIVIVGGKYFPLGGWYFPLAVIAGLLVSFFTFFPRKKDFMAALKERFVGMVIPGLRYKTALLVLGLMFFQHALHYTGDIVTLAGQLVGLGIPLPALLFLLPLLMGLIIGENATVVAIIFPLFIPLLSAAGTAYNAQVTFLYFSSSLGHILSPMHPCVVLTKEYFGVSLGQMARQLLPPMLAVAALGVLQLIIFG